MLTWGIVWGAVLGLFWFGNFSGEQMVLGAVVGALAGWSLRKAVRTEVAAQWARLPQTAVPAAQASPDGTEAPRPSTEEVAAEPSRVEAAEAPDSSIPIAATPEPALKLDAQGTAPPLAPAALDPDPEPYGPATPTLVEVWFAKARDWLLGGNTIVRLGVLVLFVGLAFLARYAIDHALLPPELRLAAIAAAGIALFVTGWRLRGRQPDKQGYALTLQGAGVAVLYLTGFAAFRLYAFLPAEAAFAWLAVVCACAALIALAQNAQAMAFIAFAGGFAAPLLVSTGQGSHVALFGYYLLLNVAILAIAWVRPWRALHLMGFVATFGIATAWGALRYEPDKLASSEGFLIAFYLIYVAITLIHALRHGLAARRAVDATLVFGLPLVAFGLQAALLREVAYASAFSALLLGVFYLLLASWLLRRAPVTEGADAAQVPRWLGESFAALALGFATLAVPLALDASWTAATWAVEGAGVYWMGRRQQRWKARAAGLLLQVLGAIAYLDGLDGAPLAHLAIANPGFIGAVLLAASAFGVAWWSREALPEPLAETSKVAHGFARLEFGLSVLWFGVAFFWWLNAWGHEITRLQRDADGVAQHVFGIGWRIHLMMAAWLLSAFAAQWLALPARARPWSIAAVPAWFNLPVMVLAALTSMSEIDHVWRAGGWWIWPLALLLHLRMLRTHDAGPPRVWWPWMHGGGVWLLLLLAGNCLAYAIDRAALWQGAWASVVLLVAGTGVLLLLARRAWFDGVDAGSVRWPLDRFARAYLWHAAWPLALLVWLASLGVALFSDGDARPLPYVPVLNPTDLAVALGLAAVGLWGLRLRASGMPLPGIMRGNTPLILLGAAAFVAINTVWLRIAHHYAGVAWDAERLFDSFIVQAGYSILWTLLAITCMVLAHRRAHRRGWMVGAGLLAVTVLKLFVIDLSNRGGAERIVVFIVVGVLMLVVGYFAPIPPAARKAEVVT